MRFTRTNSWILTFLCLTAHGAPKQVIPRGMLLHAPAMQPTCSKLPTSYELGVCFQLDRKHCLLVSNLDEQGGPDLCVGNDAFIFEKLSDIKPEKAIIINRAEPEYRVQGKTNIWILAKYQVGGFFVPLGALMPDGKPHPAAGTGLLMSPCLGYNPDRSDPTTAGKSDSNWKSWDTLSEFIQIRWDGKSLKIIETRKVSEMLGEHLYDTPFGRLAPMDKGFVGPCLLGQDSKTHSIRFDWNGRVWEPTKAGPTFTVSESEFEPTTIQTEDGRYLISTRDDKIAKVRIYSSRDGMNFSFLFDATNHYVPRTLNKGLDGSIYLATNPGPGFLRNPLLAYPMVNDSFAAPIIIHDQDGVRDDKGDKIPFVDHGVSANLFLEGKWRHLIFYRVCDLKERTLYGFQKSFIKRLQGDKGPIPKRATSGVYATELEFDKVSYTPCTFAEK